MHRRQFIQISALAGLLPYELFFKNTSKISNPAPLIIAPDSPEQWSNFIEQLEQWKTLVHKKHNYRGHWYDQLDFEWVQSNFNCFFLMMYDLMFYDPKKSQYTVEAFLEKSQAEFGRIDSLVWIHSIPGLCQ